MSRHSRPAQRLVVTLTTITLLAPHVTPDNHVDLLNEARHKSKRDVEHIVARLRPQPAVPATVRKLPEPKVSATRQAAGRSAPAPSERCGGSCFAPPPLRPGHRDVARAGALQGAVHGLTRDARQAAPRAGPAATLDPQRRSGRDLRSRVTLLLKDLKQDKLGSATARARRAQQRRIASHPGSREAGGLGARRWPMRVRRHRRRCRERGFLEFHHVPCFPPRPPICDMPNFYLDRVGIRH